MEGNSMVSDILHASIKLCYGILSVGIVTYILFQKKFLPKSVSKLVSKILFYPTFPLTMLNRIGNYWTPIDDTLILGCAPFQLFGHPKQLHRLGVRGVINMCSEYQGPIDAYIDLNIKQLSLPTPDHFEPTPNQINEAIKFIKQFKDKNELVYVHCKAGHGRGAAIALCWMISENPGMSAKDLNSMLRSKRKVRKTLYQQPCIQQFYQTIQSTVCNKMDNHHFETDPLLED